MIDRRHFVSSAAAAAALSALAPARISAATGKPEKTKLQVGFIPITCATPLIMAKPLGFYAKYGLDVELVKMPSWAAMRDKAIAGELDAFHMLTPMPLSISLGTGSAQVAIKLASIENINGQAITLSKKLLGRVNGPKDFKGLKLGVPFDYSMHNLLLATILPVPGSTRPRREIQIVPPPDMVAKSPSAKSTAGPEPTNQRAVYNEVGTFTCSKRLERASVLGSPRKRTSSRQIQTRFGCSTRRSSTPLITTTRRIGPRSPAIAPRGSRTSPGGDQRGLDQLVRQRSRRPPGRPRPAGLLAYPWHVQLLDHFATAAGIISRRHWRTRRSAAVS